MPRAGKASNSERGCEESEGIFRRNHRGNSISPALRHVDSLACTLRFAESASLPAKRGGGENNRSVAFPSFFSFSQRGSQTFLLLQIRPRKKKAVSCCSLGRWKKYFVILLVGEYSLGRRVVPKIYVSQAVGPILQLMCCPSKRWPACGTLIKHFTKPLEQPERLQLYGSIFSFPIRLRMFRYDFGFECYLSENHEGELSYVWRRWQKAISLNDTQKRKRLLSEESFASRKREENVSG